MSGQTDTEFDTPQYQLPASRPFHQTARWDEAQNVGAHLALSGRCNVYELYEQIPTAQNFATQLRYLQQHYTILNDDHLMMEVLAGEPALYALLSEAVNPLHRAFGENQIIHLRVQSSDDEIMVKVAVRLPADFRDDAEQALRAFDDAWWMNNCHRSNGALVFDYEIA